MADLILDFASYIYTFFVVEFMAGEAGQAFGPKSLVLRHLPKPSHSAFCADHARSAVQRVRIALWCVESCVCCENAGHSGDMRSPKAMVWWLTYVDLRPCGGTAASSQSPQFLPADPDQFVTTACPTHKPLVDVPLSQTETYK